MKESKVYSVIHLRESIFEQDYLVISAYGWDFLGAEPPNTKTEDQYTKLDSLSLSLSLSQS